jgi:hypothetical protein
VVPRRIQLQRLLRRWAQLACALAALAVVAPMALGAAMGPVMRELGVDASAHQCKCKMGPGKCGCPACLQLDRERASERRQGSTPCLRGQCDLDGHAFPFAAPPVAVLAAASTVLPVPLVERAATSTASRPPPCLTEEPPVPPPRIASI